MGPCKDRTSGALLDTDTKLRQCDETIETVEIQRRRILETLFGKIQEFEKRFALIASDFRHAFDDDAKSKADGNYRNTVFEHYVNVYKVTHERFVLVFEKELKQIKISHQIFVDLLMGGTWDTFAKTSMLLERRNRQRKRCDDMIVYCVTWCKILLQQTFYDSHLQRCVFYPDHEPFHEKMCIG